MDNISALLSPKIKAIAYNICHQDEKHLHQDLHSETVLYILSSGRDINQIVPDELPYFFSKVCWYVYHGTNKNGFKNVYRKKAGSCQLTDIADDTFTEQIETKNARAAEGAIIEEIVTPKQSVNEEYYRNLYNVYLKLGSGLKVSTATGIKQSTVYNDISAYEKKLKQIYESAYKSGQ
jgi:hypothetical protein